MNATEFGIAVAGWLVRSGPLFAVALLLAMALRRRSPEAGHLVLLAGAAAVLLVPVMMMMLPDWPALPWCADQSAASITQPETAAQISASPRASAGAANPPVDILPIQHVDSARSAMPLAPSPIASAPPAERGPALNLSWREHGPLALAIAWALGLCVAALRFLPGALRVAAMMRRACAVTDPAALEQFTALAAMVSVRRRVRLLFTAEIDSPLTAGVVRPAIVLPADYRDWTAPQLQMVLLHELLHVQRRDLAAQWLITAACTLHWLNPLAWLAAREARLSREQSCDARVLRHGVRPSEYAAVLLFFARRMKGRRRTLAALSMSRCDLSKRVPHILRQHAGAINRPWRRAALILCLLPLLLAPIAATIVSAEPTPASPKSPPNAAAPADADARDLLIRTLEEMQASRERITSLSMKSTNTTDDRFTGERDFVSAGPLFRSDRLLISYRYDKELRRTEYRALRDRERVYLNDPSNRLVYYLDVPADESLSPEAVNWISRGGGRDPLLRLYGDGEQYLWNLLAQPEGGEVHRAHQAADGAIIIDVFRERDGRQVHAESYTVDPRKAHRITSRRVLSAPGVAAEDVHIAYHEGNVGVPTQITNERRPPAGAPALRVVETITEWRMNPPLDEGEFTLKAANFPSNPNMAEYEIKPNVPPPADYGLTADDLKMLQTLLAHFEEHRNRLTSLSCRVLRSSESVLPGLTGGRMTIDLAVDGPRKHVSFASADGHRTMVIIGDKYGAVARSQNDRLPTVTQWLYRSPDDMGVAAKRYLDRYRNTYAVHDYGYGTGYGYIPGPSLLNRPERLKLTRDEQDNRVVYHLWEHVSESDTRFHNVIDTSRGYTIILSERYTNGDLDMRYEVEPQEVSEGVWFAKTVTVTDFAAAVSPELRKEHNLQSTDAFRVTRFSFENVKANVPLLEDEFFTLKALDLPDGLPVIQAPEDGPARFEKIWRDGELHY